MVDCTCNAELSKVAPFCFSAVARTPSPVCVSCRVTVSPLRRHHTMIHTFQFQGVTRTCSSSLGFRTYSCPDFSFLGHCTPFLFSQKLLAVTVANIRNEFNSLFIRNLPLHPSPRPHHSPRVSGRENEDMAEHGFWLFATRIMRGNSPQHDCARHEPGVR